MSNYYSLNDAYNNITPSMGHRNGGLQANNLLHQPILIPQNSDYQSSIDTGSVSPRPERQGIPPTPPGKNKCLFLWWSRSLKLVFQIQADRRHEDLISSDIKLFYYLIFSSVQSSHISWMANVNGFCHHSPYFLICKPNIPKSLISSYKGMWLSCIFFIFYFVGSPEESTIPRQDRVPQLHQQHQPSNGVMAPLIDQDVSSMSMANISRPMGKFSISYLDPVLKFGSIMDLFLKLWFKMQMLV